MLWYVVKIICFNYLLKFKLFFTESFFFHHYRRERLEFPFSVSVTVIQLSFEVPLLTKYKLETKIKDGVAFTSPGFENGRYPDRTEKYWELYAPHAKVNYSRSVTLTMINMLLKL